MPYFQFLWTPDSIDHVAQHGITPEEFVEVALHPDSEEKPHRRPNRVAAYGETSNGKFLKVI